MTRRALENRVLACSALLWECSRTKRVRACVYVCMCICARERERGRRTERGACTHAHARASGRPRWMLGLNFGGWDCVLGARVSGRGWVPCTFSGRLFVTLFILGSRRTPSLSPTPLSSPWAKLSPSENARWSVCERAEWSGACP